VDKGFADGTIKERRYFDQVLLLISIALCDSLCPFLFSPGFIFQWRTYRFAIEFSKFQVDVEWQRETSPAPLLAEVPQVLADQLGQNPIPGDEEDDEDNTDDEDLMEDNDIDDDEIIILPE